MPIFAARTVVPILCEAGKVDQPGRWTANNHRIDQESSNNGARSETIARGSEEFTSVAIHNLIDSQDDGPSLSCAQRLALTK
jgi:hypothetical protein